MVLAGAVSTGTLPLEFKSTALASGSWVTAADVLQDDAARTRELQQKLTQIRLLALRDCADVRLAQPAVAQRIASQLPGVFAQSQREAPAATLLVKVAGQTLTPEQLVSGMEGAVPDNCPASLGDSCAIRLTQAPMALCVPAGQVAFRTEVREVREGDASLRVRAGVWVDGVHAASFRLRAVPARAGLWALQLQHPVARGQAIRWSDTVRVQVQHSPEPKTIYDAVAHVERASRELQAGELLPADVMQSLALGRAHDPVRLRTQVGPVLVSRTAWLASDVGPRSQGWTYFEDGAVTALKPESEVEWELIR